MGTFDQPLANIAGSTIGQYGYVDAVGAAARFHNPCEIRFSPTGDRIFVADAGNRAMRVVDTTTFEVTTLYQWGAGQYPATFCIHPVTGNMYVCVLNHNTFFTDVWRLTMSGVATQIASKSGTFRPCYVTDDESLVLGAWGEAIFGTWFSADKEILNTGTGVFTVLTPPFQAEGAFPLPLQDPGARPRGLGYVFLTREYIYPSSNGMYRNDAVTGQGIALYSPYDLPPTWDVPLAIGMTSGPGTGTMAQTFADAGAPNGAIGEWDFDVVTGDPILGTFRRVCVPPYYLARPDGIDWIDSAYAISANNWAGSGLPDVDGGVAPQYGHAIFMAGEVIPPIPPPRPATPSSRPVISATLGCGDDLRVVLMTRGGGRILAELEPEDGKFSRRVDAVSDLSMSLPVTGFMGQSCCEDLAQIHPWATEIAVFRDGRDAWCGPVTRALFTAEKVEVTALDLTAWWSRRKIPPQLYANMDMAEIFERMHEAAMAPDPSPNFTIHPTPTGIIGSRNITVAGYASDFMSELANTAIDYTAYGRTVLVGGQVVPANPQLVLTDVDFEEAPNVEDRGADQATQVTVRGRNGIEAIARDELCIEFYGLLDRVWYVETITDQQSADALAYGLLQLYKQPEFIVPPTSGGLKTTAPVTLPQLIPGTVVRIASAATCRQVVQDFRLTTIEVDMKSGVVQPKFEPLGVTES